VRIRKAIIPAAGLGTRFLPATKAQPKEMLPLVDKPTIQYIIEEAIASGIEDVIIVTGKHKRSIEDHFDRSPELEVILAEKQQIELLDEIVRISNLIDIHYIRQKQPLGLGHAIYCARKFIGHEPFAVLLGDDLIESDTPALLQLINLHEQYATSVVAVQEIAPEDSSKYGIIAPAHDTPYISDLIEKPHPTVAPSNLAIIGRYVLEPEIFDYLERAVDDFSIRKEEIQLTDALRQLNKNKPMIGHIVNGKRYDTGDKFGYIQATIEVALRRPELSVSLRPYLLQLAERIKGE
jgi:UTP--glucose-1-phosphate uridylyltransferase